jgi:hypothetical protein
LWQFGRQLHQSVMSSMSSAHVLPLMVGDGWVMWLLAGSLPKCMNETTVVTGMEGTYLSQVALSPYRQTGGVCDDSAPDCDPDVGCV